MEDLLEKLIDDKCWLILMMSGGDFAAAVFHKYVFVFNNIFPIKSHQSVSPLGLYTLHIANKLRNPKDIYFHFVLFSA